MVEKRTWGDKLFDLSNIIFLILLTLMCVYPIWHTLVGSFSEGSRLMQHTGFLFYPLEFSLEAYRMVFKDVMIVKGYVNTLFVLVFGLAVNISFTSLAAYVVSRKDVLLSKVLMKFIVFTMFFSGGLIPLYLTVRSLNLLDKLWALILPVSIITYYMIILRTNFQVIPASLEESAKLDGANDFIILIRIILPLSKAALAVMVLYYGVMHWNSWFNAMIFLRKRELYPLQLILREILISNSAEAMMGGVGMQDRSYIGESIKYATIVVATFPILCIYPFLQKYFIKGVMIGALKG